MNPESPAVSALMTAYNDVTGQDAKPFVMKGGKAAPARPSVGPAPSHYHEYVNACLQGGPTTSAFDWACRMTEWGFLGNLAQLQPGQRLVCKDMK